MSQSLLSSSASSLNKSRPWQSFAAGYCLQAVMVVVLVRVAMMAPQVVTPHDYKSVSLYLPVEQTKAMPQAPVHHIQAPPQVAIRRLEPPKVALPKEIAPPPVVVAKVEPAVVPPVVTAKPQPPKPVETGKFDNPNPLPKPAGNPNKPVETGAFSGSSAVATIKAPINKVQTGGFGDPNGVPAQNSPNKNGAQIAKMGSFDLPQGEGYGNGTGGKNGKPGTVASAGFGSGVAGPGSGDNNGGGRYSVKQAGFGDAQPPAVVQAKVRTEPAHPAVSPVEVLQKPVPTYTDEARKLHIEGEVLLEVQFTASGKLRVLRVVRGLGHGLDEAAMAAAEKIHYKPAMRQGQPVDSTATLHIVFQMA
jgi:TonB family protein